MVLSSVSGLLSLLREDDEKLQASAVTSLLQKADEFWNEISECLGAIEELYENTAFPERKKAALLLSKVFYHLGEYNEAFIFSLAAGDMFDIKQNDQYTHTIIHKCIDKYIELRQLTEEEAAADKQYAQLDSLFSSLVNEWIATDTKYQQISEHIGLCMAAKRLDILEKMATEYIKNTHSADVLTVIMKFANQYVDDVDFRESLLRCVVKMYSHGPEKLRSLNLFDMQQCLIFLNDHAEVVRNLCMLLDSESAQSNLIAYQLAFDLFDHCNQDFLHAVSMGVKEHLKADEKTDTERRQNYYKVLAILTGAPTTELQFQFLYSQNCGSIEVMNNLKKAVEIKKSAITHNAAVMANAIMFCGTTSDQFLRENLDWLVKANNWARFTATATLGVINKGHVSQSMQVLQSYLPSAPGASGASPYQEGGALFGLGLIHAPVGCNLREDAAELVAMGAGENEAKGTKPKEVLDFLVQCVQANQQSEQLIHGACLGIGLCAMSSKDDGIYELLKQVLYNDNAVSGEAAAVAIGLVYLGSGNQRAVQELLSYGKDTEHEKIIRGVSMSLAMLMYGREGHADALIEEMLLNNDPWLRLGGVQVIGSAYAGTGNRKALERLLSVAVQDVSDDVRRAAILEVGFLTFKEPQLCVNLTSVFCDSHNPHVRWGVASALGIAAAGTGNKQALERLWTLKDDTCDFVRQVCGVTWDILGTGRNCEFGDGADAEDTEGPAQGEGVPRGPRAAREGQVRGHPDEVRGYYRDGDLGRGGQEPDYYAAQERA
eukprot:TRINITY_DN22282_c0_g1_i2.p1 TRINITY_DN22282_c0_g1~~TRINITY_DN22282_c0_g1_i2.p1  ORF type:complete len:783 (+),score=279.48 TRINITY_DN22282_c0_g1_i2:32-2350(+)